ncbi:putative ATPase [Haloactinospora alba]|uniref:Putative ATPase n=1 Tax=Haloactinospora alba TaxID=405555 RepID=A0A543N7L9_9ACTN|nr:BTAD domain-containing putative transcriptional regulator [Haloactinospora alba]TQN27822.1 putative ATPase [Haloactinospora alba]
MLGPFTVRDSDGRTIPVEGHRVVALLARLALSPGETVPARTLVEDLWDGDPPAGGKNTLQRLVSRTRGYLREHGSEALLSGWDGYILDVAPHDVDAWEFEHLAAEGSRLLNDQAPGEAVLRLRSALDMWGEPLADVDTAFARTAAHRLRETHRRAVEDRIDAESRLDDPARFLPQLRALCAEHPHDERAHGLLMRLLRENGQDSEALTVYENLRRALAADLGADPAPWVRDLHTELLRGHAPTPAPRGNTAPGPYLTRFLGRDGELAEVGRLFRDTRLVTLFGPGGVGKTRLAAEFAGGSGARFVDLSPLRTGHSITDAVASAAGVESAPVLGRALPDQDRFARIASALSGTLLVLDNCEHLIDDAADFALRLLAECPDVRVLATSREPLAVAGEATLALDTLDPESPAAVELFREHAALARPGFSVTDDNEAAVREVCRRLDGLPLALELAAARVRTMTVPQVAQRLDERFQLLSGVRRSTLARHQTLRAVLDWSWDLLTGPESALARRLSVLPGGATAHTAAAVCAGEGVPESEVPYLLASLADKSLVHTVVPESGEARYRLLETPRVYLRERLREAGEEEVLRERRAAHFVGLSERTASDLLGPDQCRALEVFDREYDNALAVVRGGAPEPAARVVMALSWYWIIRGRYEEAEYWTRGVPADDDGERAAALAALRTILPVDSEDGREPSAMEVGQRARRVRALDSYPPLAVLESKCWLAAGEHEQVRASAERARRSTHPWVRAAGLASLALVAEATGDSGTAERCTAGAVREFRAIGDPWMTAQLVAALSKYQSLRGDVDAAVRDLRDALELLRPVGSADSRNLVLVQLGGELLRSGRLSEAERTFTEMLTGERTPVVEHRVLCALGLSELELARDRPERARERLAEARSLFGQARFDTGYLRVEVLRQSGAVLLASGRVAEAEATAGEAAAAAEAIGESPSRALVAELVAEVHHRKGESASAARALGDATRTRGRRDDGSPRVRELAAALRESLGPEEFRRHYRA